MSYQLLVSAFYIGITKVILIWVFFILMEQKANVSGTPCAQLYLPMCCQKVHVPLQNVPITIAASLLGVTSSLNSGKRNTCELARMFLSAGEAWPVWRGRSCHRGCISTARLHHPKSSCYSSSALVNPWQRLGCQHDADARGVINMRTSLWQALSKHAATQPQGVWSTTSDKALSIAKFFGQQTESRSSVVAAPDMPQAAFPLHKAKTAQEKEQERIISSPLMPSPPSPAPCLWQYARGARLSTKKSKGRGQMHPVTCCTQPHHRH